MKTFNIHEAKTQLSKLVELVERGEEVMIARNGRPVAKLVGVRGRRRTPGRLRGSVRIGRDFDAPLPASVADAFGAGT